MTTSMRCLCSHVSVFLLWCVHCQSQDELFISVSFSDSSQWTPGGETGRVAWKPSSDAQCIALGSTNQTNSFDEACLDLGTGATVSRTLSLANYHTIHLFVDLYAVQFSTGKCGNGNTGCYLEYKDVATSTYTRYYLVTENSAISNPQMLLNESFNDVVNNPDYNNLQTFYIRLGNDCSAPSVHCWFDNLEVWGIPYTSPPSSSPSYSPTSATSSPTQSPSAHPTVAPTESPTTAPTYSPSEAPTFSPTTSPSATPSFAPSVSPTVVTASPTNVPTSTPSISPTKKPSTQPTPAPILLIPLTPSRAPTTTSTRPDTTSTSVTTTSRPSTAVGTAANAGSSEASPVSVTGLVIGIGIGGGSMCLLIACIAGALHLRRRKMRQKSQGVMKMTMDEVAFGEGRHHKSEQSVHWQNPVHHKRQSMELVPSTTHQPRLSETIYSESRQKNIAPAAPGNHDEIQKRNMYMYNKHSRHKKKPSRIVVTPQHPESSSSSSDGPMETGDEGTPVMDRDDEEFLHGNKTTGGNEEEASNIQADEFVVEEEPGTPDAGIADEHDEEDDEILRENDDAFTMQ